MYKMWTPYRKFLKIRFWFKDTYLNITLPPKPFITWDTWLSTVIYYSNNFKEIKNVVLNFDSDAAMANGNKKDY